MPELYDVDEVLQAMREVVAERGEDYVYERPGHARQCLYVHDRDTDAEAPGCIVGAVYHKLTGRMVPRRWEGSAADREGREVFTPDAVRVALGAQRAQDSEETWGDALRHAEALAFDLVVKADARAQAARETGDDWSCLSL